MFNASKASREPASCLNSNIPAKIVKGTVLTNILKAFFAPYLKELNLE